MRSCNYFFGWIRVHPTARMLPCSMPSISHLCLHHALPTRRRLLSFVFARATMYWSQHVHEKWLVSQFLPAIQWIHFAVLWMRSQLRPVVVDFGWRPELKLLLVLPFWIGFSESEDLRPKKFQLQKTWSFFATSDGGIATRLTPRTRDAANGKHTKNMFFPPFQQPWIHPGFKSSHGTQCFKHLFQASEGRGTRLKTYCLKEKATVTLVDLLRKFIGFVLSCFWNKNDD